VSATTLRRAITDDGSNLKLVVWSANLFNMNQAPVLNLRRVAKENAKKVAVRGIEFRPVRPPLDPFPEILGYLPKSTVTRLNCCYPQILSSSATYLRGC
jgi:hypothetical protein